MNKLFETPQDRLEALDWLRGLMALSIMVYHFGTQHDAAHPIGRLGIYGVSIFFILSGLSMAIAYDRYITDARTSINFFIRRLFRIWPLLWLAVALQAIPTYLSGKGPFGNEPYSVYRILLNLTTLAGFDNANGYINVGAWSIGNEMVYYIFTPILIYAFHWSKLVGNLVTCVCGLISLFFAFTLLNSSNTLASQFEIYGNPFNNLFLYCAGLAIYFNFRNFELEQPYHWPVLLGVIILFFTYPASGDQINIVTGFNRIAMSIISIGVVLSFYKCTPVMPGFVSDKLSMLGVATYGVYLLHPIVGWYIGTIFNIIEQFFDLRRINYIRTATSIPLTIYAAMLIYKYFEAPFINLGKRLTK